MLRRLSPVLAVTGALLAAFVANFALPHMVVHGLEAFAAAWSVFLVVRLNARLFAREQELVAAREDASRGERLASLTALAAGAAHELATPLATIAVIAGDLARDPALGADAKLLRDEVKRCRDILARMRPASDGELDDFRVVTASELAAAVRERLPASARDRLDLVLEHDAPVELCVPLAPLAQALAGLAKNGVEASAQDERVRLYVGTDERGAQILVEDHGAGIADDVKARMGEPFFTTKAVGEGMGLGVFLARLVAERLGGDLFVESALGEGTRVMLDLPRASVVRS
jgi:two-component system sensor histidine kinase RegB